MTPRDLKAPEFLARRQGPITQTGCRGSVPDPRAHSVPEEREAYSPPKRPNPTSQPGSTDS